MCGTDVPVWMHTLFGGLDDQPQTRQLVAATVAAEQGTVCCTKTACVIFIFTRQLVPS